MKVYVTRSGGIAGLRRTWAVATDEQPDREWWEELLGRLPWDERSSCPPQPDRYVYEIRYSRRRVTIPEQLVTGPWLELVERVKQVETTR
ncbi:hypothetical protein B0I08_102358 [Glaciihabitans tibetensis]|uniref:Uncharacterized protein n=1 Tax=Glaciihabitans tibetensis TaxID=1266600 RepID=A0A2T0VHN8_9MICO|nr:protealysin inhibitor emfourin [Glaciihabitans tibetensis]PRY69681.1 hypothetical protein B0I08_102358 [Glaciihabitans tibetensis]